MQEDPNYIVNKSVVGQPSLVSNIPPLPQSPNMVPSNTNPWQLEHLIKQAFLRTKERFVSYFLAVIVSFGLYLVAFFALIAVILVTGLLYGISKSVLLTVFLGFIILVVFLSLFVFIGSWTQLAAVEILIGEERIGVIDTYKKVKPLVWGYVWFSALSMLFMIGLFPLSVLSLFIILILWSVWSSFVVFVYLRQGRRRLDNLWVSRSMVNQRFWGIVGRIILVSLAILFINILLVSSKNSLLGLSSVIFSLFTTPFAMSFNYEIYKNLREPTTVEKPKVWLVFSVVGWILGMLIFAISFGSIIYLLRSVWKTMPPPKFPSPFKSPPLIPGTRNI